VGWRAISGPMARLRSLVAAVLGLCVLAGPASAHEIAHSDPLGQFDRFAGHRLQARAAAGAAALPGLARTWCGVENTVHGLLQSVSARPDLRLVYAYPADAPNQFG
jgi:hypothetical protein